MAWFLLAVLVLSATPALAVPQHCDVIVIGGGGSGAHFSVFAKDNGHKVCVLEIQGALGGHCSTRALSSPINGTSHIELGFLLLHNTTRNNERGFYNAVPYSVNMVQHIRRFADIEEAGPFAFAPGQTYTADVEHEEGFTQDPPTPAPVLTALVTAVANYLRIMYPELEDGRNPDVMREILRQPIRDFFQTEPFLKNFAGFFTTTLQASGVLPFANVSAFNALRGAVGSSLMAFVEEGWLFKLQHGCSQMYNNITAYLRAGEAHENVFLNAVVTQITRPGGSSSQGNVVVHFRIGAGPPQHLSGQSLVIAIPPTLENFRTIGLELQQDEINLFQHFEVSKGYFGVRFENASIDFRAAVNTNLQDPLGEINPQITPLVYTFCDFGNASSCHGFAVSTSDADVSGMSNRIQDQENRMEDLPNPLSLTMSDIVQHQGYFPHPLASVLQANPGFYGQINALQGRSHTYLIGAALTHADRTLAIEHAKRVADQFFPPPTRRDATESWPMIDTTKITLPAVPRCAN